MTVCLKRLLPAVVWRQVDIRTLQQSVDTTATTLVRKKCPKKKKKKKHIEASIQVLESLQLSVSHGNGKCLEIQQMSNCDSDLFQSAHLVYSTCMAMATKGVGRPRTPSGAMSWGSYQTDAAIWHSRRHQTCQKVHYLILKVNKVLWSIEGKFHGGTALWNIWRSHKRGTFMTFGGHWWTFFVCLWKSRQILLNRRVGWRSGQAGLIRDYGWKLQRTLRPGCLPFHTIPYLVCAHRPSSRLMPPSSHRRPPPVAHRELARTKLSPRTGQRSYKKAPILNPENLQKI